VSAQDRRQILLRAMRERRGPWTTGMVWRLYHSRGHAPTRKTARDDLALLARQGVLIVHGPTNGRYYTLNTWTGAAA